MLMKCSILSAFIIVKHCLSGVFNYYAAFIIAILQRIDKKGVRIVVNLSLRYIP